MSGDGAEIRDQLILQYQRACIFAGRPLVPGPYLAALVCGRAVQYTTGDGSRRVLDDGNQVREWMPDDAGLPGAEA